MQENPLFLTPRQIVAELDNFIIGQADAKRNVAIALRNRWRRMQATPEIRKEIVPNNILMIGATGVGKTEIARRLASIANAPFIKVEASKYTEVGYVGRDVESMVRDLIEQAIKLVKNEKKVVVQQKALENTEEQLLDILIPPMKIGDSSDVDQNESTRKLFLEKLKKGELDDRKIEIDIRGSGGASANIGVMGPMGMDDNTMLNIQDMIEGMMPKRHKKRKMTIADARKVILEEESAKLIDMDEVKELAIHRAENTGIIFIDEIDKIASSSNNSGEVSRQGVQRDLLPIVEGSAVNTKHGIVNTDHILFIAAGAFHVAKPSDLIPELQGRFPIRVELENLTEADFYQILKTPQNSLTKQYTALLETEAIRLNFQDEALVKIAEIAFTLNQEIENIGARRLQTVMSTLLNDILFDVPDFIQADAQIEITAEMVESKLRALVVNTDLSHYIL